MKYSRKQKWRIHIWMMHYCYSLLHERSRTRVQHKLQHQIQMCSDCISCSATYFDFWWRRLRFLLTEVWREKMKARRSRLRLQGSSTVVCLEGQQTFCGSFDCLFVFRIPKISQERNSYALQSSASSYGGHSNRSSKVQKKRVQFLMMIVMKSRQLSR